ncbi:MAG TPA: SRPBCC family protein [Caldimonas sp.]|nr:SRPBCC family protein [Caldimonas sp.]
MLPFRSIPLRILAHGHGLVATPPVVAQSVAHSVSVREEVELGVPPARAWDAIRDYLAWPAWHPAFASTRLVSGDGRSKGSVRVLTAKDGAQFTEELLRFDAVHHRLKYRILESPAPVIGYESTLEVKPSKAGSTVVWSSRFQVRDGTPEADAKKAIVGIYRLGLDNLATAIE